MIKKWIQYIWQKGRQFSNWIYTKISAEQQNETTSSKSGMALNSKDRNQFLPESLL